MKRNLVYDSQVEENKFIIRLKIQRFIVKGSSEEAKTLFLEDVPCVQNFYKSHWPSYNKTVVRVAVLKETYVTVKKILKST